jgi:2,4-dienoyl-CoA reductase-like NADH-dependent reductase (Old Yellow Enzyme family)
LSHADLFKPLSFAHGPTHKNRFMLAPLTNLQSHPDGRLSDEEFHWLTMRAKGGFGLTMTCAAHVQAVGQGFPGQLGVFGDQHLEGLTRLAAKIREHGSVSAVQLHHAGNRSPAELVGQAVCPSDDPETGARGLTTAEVEQLVEVNRRTDRYGGSLENRTRILFEIIDGVRRRTRPDFQLGVRLSPERFGLRLAEIRELAEQVMTEAGSTIST